MAFSTNQQIFEAVEKSKDILITFKKDCNGDNLGGAIALLLFLRKMGKKASIACDNFKLPAGYTFLPQIKEIKDEINNLRKFIISLDISRAKVDEISYDVKENELDFIVSPKMGFFEDSDISSKSSGFKYDLIFVIGTQDLEELGNIYDQDTEFFYKTPIINLDYSAANENFGQINLVSLTVSSVCDILFNLFVDYNEEMIDDDIATALLTGIITATKNFKSNKVTPTTLSTASRLITNGARRSEIVQNLYHARSLATLKLWGRILAHLKNDSKRKLVWSLVPQKDFVLTGTREENLDDVVEELIANSYEVETVVIIYEDNSPVQEKTEEVKEKDSSSKDIFKLIDKDKNIESLNLINISKHSPQDNFKDVKKEKHDINARVMVISLKNINSLDLVKNFPNAKGNDAKAEFCLKGLTLEQAEEKVINEVKTQLDQTKQ
jgi:nanoRNase/pAp phosphatase (c-di-AMP/oligoRNAs hydrolase)